LDILVKKHEVLQSFIFEFELIKGRYMYEDKHKQEPFYVFNQENSYIVHLLINGEVS
jgi:hypothetical protein